MRCDDGPCILSPQESHAYKACALRALNLNRSIDTWVVFGWVASKVRGDPCFLMGVVWEPCGRLLSYKLPTSTGFSLKPYKSQRSFQGPWPKVLGAQVSDPRNGVV